MRTALDQPPSIFDRPAARARLQRATRQGFADFLLARVADEVVDRLGTVARRFPLAADIGTPGPQVAERLRGLAQIDTVVRASPIAPTPGEQRGLTVVADEDALPFGRNRLDLAVSALALHGVNDLLGALVQIRLALRPDGLFLACFVGGRSLYELREALAVAEADIDGGASPRVAPFARIQDMSSVMQRAGFAMPVVDVDPLVVRYGGLGKLLHDLRGMGATNVLHERRRAPLKRAILLRAAEVYAKRHADPDGRLRATCELIWLSGWAPAATQPTARAGPRRTLPPSGERA